MRGKLRQGPMILSSSAELSQSKICLLSWTKRTVCLVLPSDTEINRFLQLMSSVWYLEWSCLHSWRDFCCWVFMCFRFFEHLRWEVVWSHFIREKAEITTADNYLMTSNPFVQNELIRHSDFGIKCWLVTIDIALLLGVNFLNPKVLPHALG